MLAGCALALDFDDRRLKAESIEMCDQIHATITRFLGYPGGVAHAFHNVGDKRL